MYDIRLNSDGDIDINDIGEISLSKSIRQVAKIRLQWIYNEWRLGPELGFPWFEDMFVKNPNFERIKMLVRNEIASIDGIKNVSVNSVNFDAANRKATFRFTYTKDEETYGEEITINE